MSHPLRIDQPGFRHAWIQLDCSAIERSTARHEVSKKLRRNIGIITRQIVGKKELNGDLTP